MSSAMSRSGIRARSWAGSHPAAMRIMSAKSVALGYVPKEIADEEDGFEIEIIGKRYKARPQREPLFDPSGSRMRA